jgi:hypothetical protein
MQDRRRSKQELSLQDRLSAWAGQVRHEAEKLPPGPDRDAHLKKAKQADTASRLEEWANSTESQPPK